MGAIYWKDMIKTLDIASINKETVNIEAWANDGSIIHYNGWEVIGRYWRGNIHKLKNPVNGQIRAVKDIFIFKINGNTVYL